MAGLRCLAVLLPVLLLSVVNGECEPGVPGVSDKDVCCAEECGDCGGVGCSQRPGGAVACCTTEIESAGVSCSSMRMGPCMMDSAATEVVVEGSFEGCFADARTNRTMEAQLTDTEMTIELCQEHCSEGGYYYFAVQWGIECWCASSSTDLSRHGSGTCDMDCGGDPTENCGGHLAFAAYTVGALAVETILPPPLPETTTNTEPSISPPSPSPVSKAKTDTKPSPSPPSPSPNRSPTPIMTIPDSCELSTPAFSYEADEGVAGRITAQGEGCFTMTDLYNFQGEFSDGKSKGPVFVMNEANEVDLNPDSFTGRWLLTSELHVEGGGTFYCRGTNIGGDCNVLRIESTGSNNYHEIRGWGGNLYFQNTVVTSWDTPNAEVQEDHKGGRSFINCVSERIIGDDTCAKKEKGECRMDIIGSEMGYLGFDDAESYGLTWKVRGFCEDLSNPEVFDDVDVYGDILESDIHHMYYGMYSYGHQGGVWTDNKMHDNHIYGFDPHDDSDYLTIARNEVWNNVNHGIIASKRCNNLEIFENEVYDGGAEAVGIFLHRSGDDSKIYGNYIHDIQDAGIALLESFGNEVYDNVIDGAEFGIRMNLGAANNMVYNNVFNDISYAGFFTYFGADPPWVGDGRPFNNDFFDNEVTNTAVGVKLKDSDGISVRNNLFEGTKLIEVNDAKDTDFSGNTLPSGGVCLKNVDGSGSFAGSSGLPDEC